MDEGSWHLFGQTLRQLRIEAHLSQHRLATQVPVSQATLSRYETGTQTPDEAIAARLDELLDTGGTLGRLVADALEAEDMRRRTALLGAVGGVALGAGGMLEPVRQRLDAVLTGPVTEDDALEWERVADQYSRLGDRLPAEQVLPSLLIDLDDARCQVAEVPERLRPRLLRACALLGGLAAISLAGAGHWSDAGRYWRTAQRAARLSEDRAVSCLIAGRRAVLTLYAPGENAATALSIADDSLARAEGQISTAATSALAARAQGLALLGDRAGAHATLATLENTFERLNNDSATWTAWSWREPRLHHVRSFVYSYLGNVREAVAAQDTALASYTRPQAPGAAQVRIHRAMSIIASGDPPQGARYLVNALESLDPAFRRGSLRTSAEHALRALPDRARQLPEVRRARELTSHEMSR